jgi:hypothetical protein
MTSEHFGCGHPRDKANTAWVGDRAVCLRCKRKHEAASRQRRRERETPQERYFAYRVRVLPEQLDNTRRKLAALENEARRYGLTQLLETNQ